ncbi:MAG: TetR/AcrR family transcriptional regulator [Hyphomonadaceae bacterium]|nr:TetR/AcrR family transcriptional regulator [Hyphomonadaceae bacterium]
MAKVSSARENMLAAASSLFRARGYEGIGIAQLLEKSGAPRGSLYFHFPGGKEQIGAEVINGFAERTAARFRELDASGVDIDTFIVSVFKTTAKESKACEFEGSCPIAAMAAGFGADDKLLAVAIHDCFAVWEKAIADAAQARGMTEKNAAVFASAFLASMEGAFVLSKAQRSTAPHINASRAMQALAAALLVN